MKNKFKLILAAILALALAFTFSCSNDTNNSSGSGGGGGGGVGGADPALNGTWEDDKSGGLVTLNNGNAEGSLGGIPTDKGTYTTSGNNITTTTTSVYGHPMLEAMLGVELSQKWYSKNELMALGVANEILNILFTKDSTETYSISGNKLIWGEDTYTKYTGAPSGPATTLEGTWSGAAGDGFKISNNGAFEASDEGSPIYKGTYTTSGNSITITITHYHGDVLEGFDSRWYSIAELIALGIPAELFAPETGTYLISGKTLILTLFGVTSYYTKVN